MGWFVALIMDVIKSDGQQAGSLYENGFSKGQNGIDMLAVAQTDSYLNGVVGGLANASPGHADT